MDLDSERNHAHGPMPIPWTAIVRYGEFYGMGPNEIQLLVRVIRKLDNHNLQRIAAKQSAQTTPK